MFERLPPGLQKLVLYIVFGGSAVLLDITIFTVLVSYDVWYQFANLAGYASGGLLSFTLNRSFTFKVKDAPLRRLGMFFMVAAIGFSISTAMLWVLVEQLQTDPLLAKLASLVVVLVVQFSLNSLITFRAQSPNRGRRPPTP